jgi:hypothetical protein
LDGPIGAADGGRADLWSRRQRVGCSGRASQRRLRKTSLTVFGVARRVGRWPRGRQLRWSALTITIRRRRRLRKPAASGDTGVPSRARQRTKGYVPRTSGCHIRGSVGCLTGPLRRQREASSACLHVRGMSDNYTQVMNSAQAVTTGARTVAAKRSSHCMVCGSPWPGLLPNSNGEALIRYSRKMTCCQSHRCIR